MTGTMPEFISVNDYISEVKDDISSPPTSNFVSKMPLCRQTVNDLEEVRTFIFLIFYCECPGQTNTPCEWVLSVQRLEGWCVWCGGREGVVVWESSGGRGGKQHPGPPSLGSAWSWQLRFPMRNIICILCW